MDKHSPTPWRVEIVNRTFHVDAADGGFVALFVSEADAALIVEAVNSHDALQGQALTLDAELAGARHTRDKLRALVRRLTRSLEDATDVIKQRMTTLSITLPDSSRTMLHGVDITAFREALVGVLSALEDAGFHPFVYGDPLAEAVLKARAASPSTTAGPSAATESSSARSVSRRVRFTRGIRA